MENRLRFPIVSKLVVLIVLLLLAATVPIAIKSSDQFEKVSSAREEDNTREQTAARAIEVEAVTNNYLEKVRLLGALYLKDMGDTNSAFEIALRTDSDLVGIEIWKLNQTKPELQGRKVKTEYLSTYKMGAESLSKARAAIPLASIFSDSIELRNATIPGGAPLLGVGIPLVKDENGMISHVAIGFMRLDRLQKMFSVKSERLMYLVDRDGRLLAHPDEKKVLASTQITDSPLLTKALQSELAKGQLLFKEPNVGTFVGAYAKTSMNLSVLAQVSQDIILEPARALRRQAFFITGTVLSLALFFIVVFSVSLTAPLEKLVKVTQEIARGNLAVQANIRSRDEVGDLATAFDQMTKGLQEREKMKTVLTKFHGSTVADDLISRDAELGGSRKQVTVFFSDIRDFTKFSEGHSPEEVVDMLNEYFKVMVSIIHKHHGIVDKFIGDAIMAVWGAPNTTGEDELHAARCVLEMRVALAELNASRLQRNLTEIRIGMALHTGHAISGTIGSDQRMEYTVIGDTVNMTSRIEASTKVFGTDALVSEVTAGLLSDRFVFQDAGSVQVKGKSEPFKLLKIVGYIDDAGQMVTVRTPYSEYEPQHDDKVKTA